MNFLIKECMVSYSYDSVCRLDIEPRNQHFKCLNFRLKIIFIIALGVLSFKNFKLENLNSKEVGSAPVTFEQIQLINWCWVSKWLIKFRSASL